MPRRTSTLNGSHITDEGVEPDFGTYHHSTPRESVEARQEVKILFTRAFDDLPFTRDDRMKILDVGCGLGFLSCICAEFYPNASITGFDTFEHASLKDSSLEKARRNAEILGFSDRIVFQKGDVFRSDFKKGFDLFVSSLVFHNFGKKRLDAYERLAGWLAPRSRVVLGELFLDYAGDVRSLSGIFKGVKRIPGSAMSGAYRVLVLSEPRR